MTFALYLSQPIASAQPVEQFASIKPTVGSPYLYHPVISLPIGEVKAGDVISIPAAYCQVSSRMTYNLMVASVLILTDQPMTTTTSGPVGWGNYVEVSEATGTNIDNNIHHHVVRQTGSIVAPVDIADAHLVLLVYSASTAYDGVSLLTVNSDYGRLEGEVKRLATKEDLMALLETAPPPVSEQISIVLTDEQVAHVRSFS